MQCAAVSTHFAWIHTPPQRWAAKAFVPNTSELLRILATNGYSNDGKTALPPTTLAEAMMASPSRSDRREGAKEKNETELQSREVAEKRRCKKGDGQTVHSSRCCDDDTSRPRRCSGRSPFRSLVRSSRPQSPPSCQSAQKRSSPPLRHPLGLR